MTSSNFNLKLHYRSIRIPCVDNTTAKQSEKMLSSEQPSSSPVQPVILYAGRPDTTFLHTFSDSNYVLVKVTCPFCDKLYPSLCNEPPILGSSSLVLYIHWLGRHLCIERSFIANTEA